MKIVKRGEVSESGVTGHADILKKVFIGSGEVPHITTVSVAVFAPGQGVDLHMHE